MKGIGVFLIACISIISCESVSSEDKGKINRWWTETDRQLVISDLLRTTNEVRSEIEYLSDDQWNFHEDPDRWSIAEIIEHLEMQNQLHFREISVLSKAPQYLQFRSVTQGKDSYFTKYSIDPTKSKAQWFLEPLGRYCSQEEGKAAFFKARSELTKLIEKTKIDFRKQFTFRIPVEGKNIENIKIGEVRDLHQLLLTGIAHTDRHLAQIRKIKQHPNYPRNTVKDTQNPF